MRATCAINLAHLELIILIIFGEKFGVPHYVITSSLSLVSISLSDISVLNAKKSTINKFTTVKYRLNNVTSSLK
jgi:hypothetical protein